MKKKNFFSTNWCYVQLRNDRNRYVDITNDKKQTNHERSKKNKQTD